MIDGAFAVAGPVSRRQVFADLSVRVKILAAIGVAAIVALVVGLVTSGTSGRSPTRPTATSEH